MPKKKTARAEMYWDKSRNKWRKRKYGKPFFGDTQEEVREQIREYERLMDAGMVLGDQTTLADFSTQWYKVKISNLRHNSINVYDNALSVHILPYFKNEKLADIKPLHIQKLLAEKSELSKSMQSKILGTLKQIMKTAIENGLIARNPCINIKPGGKEVKKKVPLTKQQQYDLTIAIKGSRSEVFVLLCLYAGLRREEALGLLWEDVHLDCEYPYIDIKNAVTFENGQPNFTPYLKTDAAYRSIPIPPVLSDVLKEKRNEAKSDLVIPAITSNGAMSEVAFRRMWEIVTGPKSRVVKKDKTGKTMKDDIGKPIMEKIKLPALVDFYVAPHLLRHTYATELCHSGMDIKKIQYLLGHKDVTMTLKIYTHVTRNTPQELSKDIIKTFSGTNPGTNVIAHCA